MYSENQLYMFYVEDYCAPRYYPEAKPYFGTYLGIQELMNHLSDDIMLRDQYADMVDAFFAFDCDWDAAHTIAGKRYPALTPVMAERSSRIVLTDYSWEYHTSTGAVFPMFAKRVVVEQMLFSYEGNLCRCIKPCFERLSVCCPGIGWCIVGDDIRGFPYLVNIDKAKGLHLANFYTVEQWYGEDQRPEALRDMSDAGKIKLSFACKDIFGCA